MRKEFEITSIAELNDVAKEILNIYKDQRVFLLEGNLGAGKTTLTIALCKLLGVKDEVVSPTYTIINEYGTNNSLVYHADLYRLNSIEEVVETGIEDYLYSKSYCFVEWPQIMSPILPHKFVKLVIEYNGDQNHLGRKIIAESYA